MLPLMVMCSLSCHHNTSPDVGVDIVESMHPTVMVGRVHSRRIMAKGHYLLGRPWGVGQRKVKK